MPRPGAKRTPLCFALARRYWVLLRSLPLQPGVFFYVLTFLFSLAISVTAELALNTFAKLGHLRRFHTFRVKRSRQFHTSPTGGGTSTDNFRINWALQCCHIKITFLRQNFLKAFFKKKKYRLPFLNGQQKSQVVEAQWRVKQSH